MRDVRGRPFSFACSEQVLHVPPPAATLPARMDAMVRFAEESLGDGSFLHPVVQTIVLHFWLAYDHPFEDGNGRTARALFYWSMLRRGYWVHQIDVILRALDALDEYVRTKTDQVRQVERMLRRSSDLNHRQLALLAHALRHPGAEYTTRSHRTSHAVAYATARADLFRLAELEWLERRRVGRRDNVFRAPPDLAVCHLNGFTLYRLCPDLQSAPKSAVDGLVGPRARNVKLFLGHTTSGRGRA